MLLDKLKQYHIVLASMSPRRKELLLKLDLNFEINSSGSEECIPDNLSAWQIGEYLAKQKAESVACRYDLQKTIIIGCDTLVCVDNQVLGKPSDKQEAITMLQALSGRKHVVISGLCLLHKERSLCKHDCTEVWFKTLTNEEIIYYIDNYQPFDKAGEYGIQEWTGYWAIKRIEGSFQNVVGLPTHLLWDMLDEITAD
jgi:septum formation protein